MKEVIDQVLMVRKESKEISAEFERKFGAKNSRTACFNRITNQATIAFESLNNYEILWSSVSTNGLPRKEVQRIRKENGERVIEVTKYLFINVLSVIEFGIKRIASKKENHILNRYVDRKGKLVSQFNEIYSSLDNDTKAKLSSIKREIKNLPPFDSFFRIIDCLYREKLLSNEEFKMWCFALEVRNCCIHNNGIGSKNMELEVDGRKFEIEKGKMIEDKLDAFSFLTLKLVSSLANILIKI